MLASVTSGAAALPGEKDWNEYSYEQYVAEFAKGVLTSDAHTSRRQIFKQNLETINKHNSNPSKTWYMGVNQFTDWTHAEFKQRRARGKKQSAKSFERNVDHDEIRKFVTLPDELPTDVDWRKHEGVVTPIKNQGDCGSCWAFSTAETMESALAIATGKPAPVLSPQQLVSCTPNPNKCGGSGGCDGSIQQVGFNYTMRAGLTTEQSYPYTAKTGACKPEDIKPVAKNSGFVSLTTNNYTELVSAVAKRGPIAISVATEKWQHYGGGVFDDDCGWDQDHAVQLVGYGVDAGNAYWLVRNSWDGEWGEGGYIRIKRHGEGKEPCDIDKTPQDGGACAGDTKPVKVCGKCAILSDSSYPTGLKMAEASQIMV